jgi:alpha-1,6-mannosyltransferase
VRIVDVNEFYSPTGGGVRTYVDRKMEILAAAGHELIVVAPGREDRVEERPGGGRVHFLKSPPMPFDANYGLFWDAAPIHALLDRLDPDVIENCSPWRPAWIVADWQGRAIKSFFMHDNVEAYAKRWFEHLASGPRIERAFAWYTRYMNRFLDRFDTVVANGPALQRRAAGRGLRCDTGIALGIEREHFSPTLRDEGVRAAMLRECGLPADGRVLLGIGRHHSEKRWPVVIDAVIRAGQRLPVGLILLGHGPDTRTLERHVGASPHVRLFRPVYDRRRLATLMASADAMIHGSDAEPFGLVLYEGLASGAPLIVPDAGGAAELGDPAYAETYRARDARACAEAIVRLVARDATALRAAAHEAAAHVRSDVEHAHLLVEHYRGVIAARGTHNLNRPAAVDA